MLLKSIADSKLAYDILITDIDEVEKAILILQKLADIKRKMSTEKIERLVTFGLKTVMGQDVRFKIKQKESGNQVNSEFVLESGSGENALEADLMEGESGGLAKITEFLLKVLVVLLLSPQLRRFLVCDENFWAVSAEYRSRLCELLRELSSGMNFQFLIVTHLLEMEAAADKLYKVDKVESAVPYSKLSIA